MTAKDLLDKDSNVWGCRLCPRLAATRDEVYEHLLHVHGIASYSEQSVNCIVKENITRTVSDPRIKNYKESDPINPSYYKGRDVMDIINRYKLSFCLGQVAKYILRHRGKGGYEDLQKALWYLNEEIRMVGMEPKVVERDKADG